MITYGLKLRKADESDAIEERRAQAEIARFLNHPIGTQPEFLFGMVDRTPGVDRAFLDGEQAGAEGKTCECPIVGGPNGAGMDEGLASRPGNHPFRVRQAQGPRLK